MRQSRATASIAIAIAIVLAISIAMSRARADQLPPLPPPEPAAPPPPAPTSPALPSPATPVEIGVLPAESPPALPADAQVAAALQREDAAFRAEREGRLSFFAEGGYAFREINLVPAHGGALRLGLGAQDHRFAGYAYAEGAIGRTFGGLGTREIKAGGLVEWRLSPVRLGLGADLGYTFVVRRSVDYTMWSLVAGAFAQASCDAWAWGPRGDHAAFVSARFNTNFLFYVFEFGPTVSLGVRY